MGGCNSTRWNGHAKKYTVEDCLSLDANRWMREGTLCEGIHTFGGWHWHSSYIHKQTSSIGYEVNTLDADYPWLRLYYTFTQTGDKVDYKIRLTATKPYFGGLRWWFICPLVVNGRACNRRIGKIYLPPNGRYFGCRHCYDLAYRSSQEADKRLYWLRRNPDALMEIVRNRENADASKLFLALKALKY